MSARLLLVVLGVALMAPMRQPAPVNLRGWARVDVGDRFQFGPVEPEIIGEQEIGPFGEWMAKRRPAYRWDYRHFLVMQNALDRVTRGELRRVFFQVAIRHGKTEHNSEGYGAYRIEADPRTRILVASYNATQAQKISRNIRRTVRELGIAISKDRDTAGDWETVAGGGVRAVGAGAGVASVNADLIIIDDPIGSRDEAESQAHRNRVWDWITNDLLARCEPHTAVLFTMSRWHQDDPAGRLLDQHGDRWFVVDMPGRAEPNDPLGRELDEPLWPEFRGSDWLDEKRIELGAYGFASLIQGRPRPREGGMFQWDWWQLVKGVPAIGPMVRYWDLAGTQPKGGRHDPDWSVGSLLCRMIDDRTAIVDVERFRKGVAARDARVLEVAKADLEAYGGRVRWWIETEAGIDGEERTARIIRRVQALGLPVYADPRPTTKKELRAEPLQSAAEAGNVVLCPGAWRDPFRVETVDFPEGLHDDQVDSASGAYNKLGVPGAQVRSQDYSI